MQSNPSKEPSTTTVEVPYKVLREAALDRFNDETIEVKQHVILADRIVVACASFEGYWSISNDPELTRGGAVPKATFQHDTTASFAYRAS